MKISVLIPCYNAARTIEATLASVFSQTRQPDEIILLNDGSSDDTLARLNAFAERTRVLSQANSGAAVARNRLVQAASGDIFAFLDADDLWHPGYLEAQQQLASEFPQAVAYFSCHDDFRGHGPYAFTRDFSIKDLGARLLGPLEFIREYNRRPMAFQMSCFCLRKAALLKLGGEPFCVSGGEDTYLHYLLPLLGPVAHTSLQLVAYRILDSSLSANKIKTSLAVAKVFEKLDEQYRSADPVLSRAFRRVSASGKRTCGKYLMSYGQFSDARRLFRKSALDKAGFSSRAKSLGLLCLAALPSPLQSRFLIQHLWARGVQRGVPSQSVTWPL
jgi:glycosyltransferase involved in cell wall biosynthesis